jgi:hypothetical protein
MVPFNLATSCDGKSSLVTRTYQGIQGYPVRFGVNYILFKWSLFAYNTIENMITRIRKEVSNLY